MQKHENVTKCKQAATEQVRNALDAKAWMVVCFRVTEEGVLEVQRTTCNFPVSQFGTALGELRAQLDAEIGSVYDATVRPSRLPIAPFLRGNIVRADEGSHDGRNGDDVLNGEGNAPA